MRDAERVGEVVEAAAVFGKCDGVRRGPGDLATHRGKAVRQVQRRLPSELDEHRYGGGAEVGSALFARFVVDDRGD